MRVHTKLVYEWRNEDLVLVQEEGYDYPDNAPIAKLDRWAQSQDKKNADTAGGVAANAGTSAAAEHSTLEPFYNKEINAEHLYDPTQLNEILTSAGVGNASATSAAQHDSDMLAGRTGNASGFTKSLQEMARDKMKTAASVGENVATQDVLGAKQLNQAGASGMSHLFDSDSAEQLKAMGLQTQDTANEVEAGKSGWLQNLNDTIKAVSGGITAATGGKGLKP